MTGIQRYRTFSQGLEMLFKVFLLYGELFIDSLVHTVEPYLCSDVQVVIYELLCCPSKFRKNYICLKSLLYSLVLIYEMKLHID